MLPHTLWTCGVRCVDRVGVECFDVPSDGCSEGIFLLWGLSPLYTELYKYTKRIGFLRILHIVKMILLIDMSNNLFCRFQSWISFNLNIF